ncbi:TPA: Dr family adhesin structural subunit [Escherichia coli]|nr:Dr family adhesin structural subunit [Escherichia coli]
MKKLAIMATMSILVVASTAHATFQPSGTTGGVALTVTGECPVTVGKLIANKRQSELHDRAVLGEVSVSGVGCGTDQRVAVSAGNFYDGTNGFFMTQDGGTEKLTVDLATNGDQWKKDNGVYYRAAGGDWTGKIGIIVRGEQVNKPTGKYTMNLDGGFWAN